MPHEKLGIAMVGCGRYAARQLAPALRETDKCYLSAIVTGNPETAASWQREYDIPETHVYDYNTFDRIGENDDIDIVYIVLPNNLHAEYTLRAARSGKHVITEKPMATTVGECEEMIEACDRTGVKLAVGYRLHYDPFHQEMMRLGQEQVFGPVAVVEAGYGFTYRKTEAWRFEREMAGGGALFDLGIYAIQGARYVTGEEPVRLRAQAFNTRPDLFKGIHETILWQMEFPSGAVSTHTTTYTGHLDRLHLMAPDGWAELTSAYQYQGQVGRTSDGPMNFPQVNQQALQMDDFADCVMTGRNSRVSGEEGLRDIRVIEAIYRSIDSGGGWVGV